MIDRASLDAFITEHCGGLTENLDFKSEEKYSMQFRLKDGHTEIQERYVDVIGDLHFRRFL